MGPMGKERKPPLRVSSDQSKESAMAGSSMGMSPKLKSSFPPYFLGIFSSSMYCRSVGFTSLAERMKILETVIGSNHRLTQPQTVGKNEGAPIRKILSSVSG